MIPGAGVSGVSPEFGRVHDPWPNSVESSDNKKSQANQSEVYASINPSRIAQRQRSTRSVAPITRMMRYLWLSTAFCEIDRASAAAPAGIFF